MGQVTFFIDSNDSSYSNCYINSLLTFGSALINIDLVEELDVLVRIEEIYDESDPVMGLCYGDGSDWILELDSRLAEEDFVETLFHELVHLNHLETDILEQKEAEAALYAARMKGLWYGLQEAA